MITTDICIIGAGPVGLFAVFEAGLLKMRCHLVDALPEVGGQLTEIYPKKPIYDIPGAPGILAEDLIRNLLVQIEDFRPTYSLGERVEAIQKQPDNSMIVRTNEDTQIHCQVVVLAAGLGSFEPRKPAVSNLEYFEGKGVNYMVKSPELFRAQKVVLAGGGDSALDWAIYLSEIAERVTLIHRNETFRGAPDSAAKVMELAHSGKIDLFLQTQVKGLGGNGRLNSVEVVDQNKKHFQIPADSFIPLFGLSPKLGPIANWGLGIDKSAVLVNTLDYSTTEARIYAIGDINTYPGKLKLILCGFHEAAIMMQSAFKFVYPEQKLSFKYTTVNGINTF
ncbi:NAD(P)/FAD-dependent oxidoreductase [Dyadobacter tibetensis]|uniref:NAD(P)/FAD-dependent oxidoreductase n=1 Tax=Dyadobacter tibetensis TaxID=1211851 RepID=UPI00046F84DC|nr:NAD(P)/FAD-dependent oxidoreductase [Dyadobacter tibetensis]